MVRVRVARVDIVLHLVSMRLLILIILRPVLTAHVMTLLRISLDVLGVLARVVYSSLLARDLIAYIALF